MRSVRAQEAVGARCPLGVGHRRHRSGHAATHLGNPHHVGAGGRPLVRQRARQRALGQGAVSGQAVVHAARALVQQRDRRLLVARGERTHGGARRHGDPHSQAPRPCRASPSHRIRCSPPSTPRWASTSAWRCTTSSSRWPTPRCSPARASSAARTLRPSSAAWPRCARRWTATGSWSSPTTRTCTWPSSGGSPRSSASRAPSCTRPARATTRWPPTWRCWCGRTASAPRTSCAR